MNSTEREAEVRRLFEDGATYQNIADSIGVSRQRAYQIAHYEMDLPRRRYVKSPTTAEPGAKRYECGVCGKRFHKKPRPNGSPWRTCSPACATEWATRTYKYSERAAQQNRDRVRRFHERQRGE